LKKVSPKKRNQAIKLLSTERVMGAAEPSKVERLKGGVTLKGPEHQ